jgi:type II secretory pathway pseudopilin PulG
LLRARPASTCGSRDLRGGFTLIEVLVAFLVLAFGTLVIQQAVMTGLQGSERADDRLRGELVARSLLSAPMASNASGPAGSSGTLDGMAWSIRFEPVRLPFPTTADSEGKAPAWIPLRMIVTVTLAPRRRWSSSPATVRLETVRLAKAPVS